MDNPNKIGRGQTVGATSLELVTVPMDGVAAVLINAVCLGYNVANPSQALTYANTGGGGILGGAITLLPALGGGLQKPALWLSANVSVTLASGFMVMTVTGQAGTTIQWGGKIELLNI